MSAATAAETAQDLPTGTVAMIAAAELDPALMRSLTAEFARRGTVHAAQAESFATPSSGIQAVRWSVTLDDSDDDFGSQFLVSLLEDAAEQLRGRQPSDNPEVTTTVLSVHHRPTGQMMLVMDVDSTLIDQEVIDLLAAHAGKEAEVAEVTERAMRGELDFSESLHARVAVLQDLPEQVLQQTLLKVTPTEGAPQLLETFRRRGYPAFAVSGGFEQILQPLAEQLGLTGYRANILELRDRKLTGKVTGQVVDRAVKREQLKHWALDSGVPVSNVVAVGDGANDLDMLGAAGVGVAFCAKPALAEQADLVISHRNMQLISYALGLTPLEVPAHR
ncbi:phosphoserine phosphatase SerB [Nesterenkonia massiliensis]|uniref:phosphoserine phosphatase SerB n=1 Tax=Nesterenkonia massiliensis TaxID=1232429 RepID=UPI000404A235|nr:phosphoserine phosphatase SerB [Nesterenkonia massiliensis]